MWVMGRGPYNSWASLLPTLLRDGKPHPPQIIYFLEGPKMY